MATVRDIVALDGATDAVELLDNLDANGYEIIRFPGAITSKREYLDWLAGSRDVRITGVAGPL